MYEDAPINQILAYVGVYDPDAGENGTLRSIDLALVELTRASESSAASRREKIERIRLAGDGVIDEASEVLVRRVESELSDRVHTVGEHEMPVKLNKIGDKLFTLQLAKRVSFDRVEAYAIEMRIRDNGTRPQLESSTRINLNVIDRNNYPPIFLNSPRAEILVVEG